MANFDSVAGIYALLEYGVFGTSLQLARGDLLVDLARELGSAPKILVPGEGDGRLALVIHQVIPEAQLVLTEASKVMRTEAEKRLNGLGPDKLMWLDDLREAEGCDAVICCFYLDCIQQGEQRDALAELLHVTGANTLLLVDFVPPGDLKPWVLSQWCRLLERAMIHFFNGFCGTNADRIADLDRLPDLEDWKRLLVRCRYGGFVKASLWKKATPCT